MKYVLVSARRGVRLARCSTHVGGFTRAFSLAGRISDKQTVIVRRRAKPLKQGTYTCDFIRRMNRRGQLRIQIKGIPVHLFLRQPQNFLRDAFEITAPCMTPNSERRRNAAFALEVFARRMQGGGRA